MKIKYFMKYLSASSLTRREFKIALFILYMQPDKYFELNYNIVRKICIMDNREIRDGIKGLLDKKIISRTNEDNQIIYEINYNFKEWTVSSYNRNKYRKLFKQEKGLDFTKLLSKLKRMIK